MLHGDDNGVCAVVNHDGDGYNDGKSMTVMMTVTMTLMMMVDDGKQCLEIS